jgi:hypothetical protein
MEILKSRLPHAHKAIQYLAGDLLEELNFSSRIYPEIRGLW